MPQQNGKGLAKEYAQTLISEFASVALNMEQIVATRDINPQPVSKSK